MIPDLSTIDARQEAWAQALESGVYSQTQARLNRPDEGMCCLGVQCDLFLAARPDSGWRWSDNIFAGGIQDRERHRDLPPDEVVDFFGIDSTEVDFYVNMNDNGRDFAHIARAIRDLRRNPELVHHYTDEF